MNQLRTRIVSGTYGDELFARHTLDKALTISTNYDENSYTLARVRAAAANGVFGMSVLDKNMLRYSEILADVTGYAPTSHLSSLKPTSFESSATLNASASNTCPDSSVRA